MSTCNATTYVCTRSVKLSVNEERKHPIKDYNVPSVRLIPPSPTMGVYGNGLNMRGRRSHGSASFYFTVVIQLCCWCHCYLEQRRYMALRCHASQLTSRLCMKAMLRYRPTSIPRPVTRDQHGFTDPCGSCVRVTVGVGPGHQYVTHQPIITRHLYIIFTYVSQPCKSTELYISEF